MNDAVDNRTVASGFRQSHFGYEKVITFAGYFQKQVTGSIVKDYSIQFSGLAEGVHTFSFVLDSAFFGHFDEQVISDGRVDVAVSMEKLPRMLIFSFDIKGVVEVLCDRCADPLLFPVEGSEKLIAKVSEEGESTDTDIVFISEEAFAFDLSQHLFDYVHLMLPLRMTHDDSANGQTCDPDMIRLLQQYSANKPVEEGLPDPGEGEPDNPEAGDDEKKN